MKIKYLNKFLCFLAFFWCAITFVQVTNSISDLKVNNSAATQINFNSNATVDVSFKVKLQTFNGDFNNVMGNLFVYSKSSPTASPIQRGFMAIVFTETNPPFVPQTTYDTEYTFTISLDKSHFFATGGVLYAEYKNNNDEKFKSSDISIVGGTAINPNNQDESFKILSVKNTTKDLFPGKIFLSDDMETVRIYISFQHRIPIGELFYHYYYVEVLDKNGGHVDFIFMFNLKTTGTGTLSTYTDRYFDLPTHYFTDGGAIRMQHTGPSSTSHSSNSIPVQTITFTKNTISASPKEIYEGVALSMVNTSVQAIVGKVFDSRYNIYRPLYAPVDEERLYKKSVIGEWEFIGSVLPLGYTLTETTYFQRKSFYKKGYCESNIEAVTFIPTSEYNTICCDQSYTYNVPLNPIVGNTPPFRVASYTWQKYSRGTWATIAGATSKDYTPVVTFSSRESSVGFRRLVQSTTGIGYYSNEVKVYNGPIPSSRYIDSELIEN